MSLKRFFSIFILLVIILLASFSSIPASPAGTYSERPTMPSFIWESYQPRTFQDVIRDQMIPANGNEPFYIAVDMYRSRVGATYSGESRDISDARRALISAWFEANQADSRYRKLFAKEWRFLSDGQEYWLPVQAQTAEYMQQEFEPGEQVTLLVVLLGADKQQREIDWLFVVNEVLPE